MRFKREETVMRKSIWAVLSLALIASQAVAQSVEVPRPGGTLIYSVVAGEPDTYDCHATLSVAVMHRVGPHYSTLLKYDPVRYPEIVGDVAESWTVSADGRVYTFLLRDGIKFHDGSDFSSADVKATYERLRNPPEGVVSARRPQFKDIESIDTPDTRTVVFKLARANAGMLAVFANPYNCLYSAAKLAIDPKFPQRNILGTGPFKFVEHVAGSEWRGERFDNYFVKGRPHLDGFRALNIATTAVVTALSGNQIQADLRGIGPPDRERVLAANPTHYKMPEAVATNMLMLTFNATRKPYDDPRVRRAMSLAIDRWTGAKAMERLDFFNVAGGFLRPGTPLARSQAELEQQPGFGRDIMAARAEAKRLLAEVGVTNLTGVLWNRPPFTALGTFLIDQWRQVGITVTQEQPENQRFFAAYNTRNFDFVIDSFQGFPEDPMIGYAALLSAEVNPSNKSEAVDRQLDELYAKIVATSDVEGRKAAAQAFEGRILSEAYSVPLFWGVRIVPLANEVRGYSVTPSFLVGEDLADVWLARQ
jgi:peptide/nickel transport system substrate-binding protein